MSGSGSGGGSGSGSGWASAINAFASNYSLNGSSAPNNSALPLSTPLNTSNGNGGSSGALLSTVLSGLQGWGTSAGAAYQMLTGQAPSVATPTGALGPAPVVVVTKRSNKYLPWIVVAVVIVIVAALLRRK